MNDDQTSPQPLALRPENLAVDVRRPEPSVGEMLRAVLEKGITAESVEAVKSLTVLYEHMQDRDAEKSFARAFNSLQADMPKVQATKAVPNNDGTTRYKFAPFEEIMSQVGPMLLRHGFTVSFSNRYDQNRIISTCTLQHVEGHKRSNDFAVRTGSGPPKASESQADGAAATYAKRFALTEALNIVVAHLDDDARLESSEAISKQQSDSLRERVKNTASNESAFLKFAGAKTFEEISTSKYAMLDENLRRKETTR